MKNRKVGVIFCAALLLAMMMSPHSTAQSPPPAPPTVCCVMVPGFDDKGLPYPPEAPRPQTSIVHNDICYEMAIAIDTSSSPILPCFEGGSVPSLIVNAPWWIHFEDVDETAFFCFAGNSPTGERSTFRDGIELANIYSGSGMEAIAIGFQDPVFRNELAGFLSQFPSEQPLERWIAFQYENTALLTKDPELILNPFPIAISLVCENGSYLINVAGNWSVSGIMKAYLTSALEDVPESAFKNPNNKQVLQTKINEVVQKFKEGAWIDAQKKLEHDIIAKVDGAFGGNPKNDWVVDYTAVAPLYRACSKKLAMLKFLNE